jgi:hypothetical protein
MAPGFVAIMDYSDGYGSGQLPKTGRTVHKSHVKGSQNLTPGSSMTMASNPKLGKLFSFPENTRVLKKGKLFGWKNDEDRLFSRFVLC